ncbi:MAG: NlpC/P60 family protein [Nitriliruptoraceae bacterium]
MPVHRFLLCLPATLLALIIAGPASAQEDPTFVDTVGTSHEVAVERLVAEGLIQGCSEDRFCSTDDLTRGQMASILSRALGLREADAVEDDDVTIAAADDAVGASFVDIEDSVHAEAVELLATEGLVKGCEEGRFCPNDSLTRGQLATLLGAAFDLEPASGEETFFIDGAGVHAANIETLGANGISNGCGPVTFCSHDTVQRSHAALFLTRTLGLTEPVTFAPFEERLAEHEEAERQRLEQERIEAERRREREERERLEAPGQVAVDVAVAQLGKPYQWGGNGPGSFDCSGLVIYSFRAAGITSLPRSSSAQYGATTRISRSELRPGDLVFYHSPISHVAIYIGDGKVVEAPNSGNNVRIRNDGITRSGVVGFGRVR